MTSFKLKLKAKYCPKKPHICFDLVKLKDPKVAKVFQAQVGGKFAALNPIDSSVETLTGNIKEVLHTTAEEVLGKRWKKIQPWIMNEVLGLCNKRRELRGKKHSSNKAQAQYQNVHRQVRKKIQIAKEEWIEEWCSTIKKGMETGNSKNAYSTLKSLTKTSQPRSAVINDQDGKLLTDSKKVLKRWTEYCKGLYIYKIHPDDSLLQTDRPSMDDKDSLPILKEEVEAAVWSLKLGKSSGVDKVPSELVKMEAKKLSRP